MVKMESLLSIWIENQNQRRMPLSKMMIPNKDRSIFNDVLKNTSSSSIENLAKFEASQGRLKRLVAFKEKSASADIGAQIN